VRFRPHKTKIVATIGPASSEPAMMERLVDAGMDVARLNLSHGSLDEHARVAERLRAAARAVGRRLALLADLPGPKLRIGRLAAEPVELRVGDVFTLSAAPDAEPGDARRVAVSFERLPDVVRPGDTCFLNDGLIRLEVERVEGREVRCRVAAGGELRSRKGLNLPGVDLGIDAFTPRDREGLAFAVREGLDVVSQSFVESAADVAAVRRAAAELGGAPFVVAKIERARALERTAEILDAADGVMVARGDLGVEIPLEDIAPVQKRLVREANLRGKPVVTATQMLESMTASPRPTRAEATDVANAILDGTDAVMLSGESAVGHYPVEAVAMLARIARAAERERPARDAREALRRAPAPGDVDEHIARAVDDLLTSLAPALALVPTRSGATARRIARFRPPVWLAVVSPSRATRQRLQLSWGVHALELDEEPADWRDLARRLAAEQGLPGRHALVVAGPSPEHPDASRRVEIVALAGAEGGAPGGLRGA
jgi:pyruvate kinase